ncbi:hypothetical protein PA25_29960 [Pseudoalteromonas sp. A25]|uniref:AAA family ATPase n=1 Tax=Pseudoalteromonas sp. A25 TaxID=116092 RepID=UPI0012610A96|nr:AAA family ATPase [Pseudoalteromonas sp. A25]BBN83011.1 hypothetical protein PA25_29960 [Pseudoalteromonas sp. A25]
MQSQILPSRSALVDRIALQFEYGQNLICLVGSSGLGKSYIAESFITDKYPDFNKAYVQLSASTKDSDLTAQLLQNSFRGPLVDQQQSLSQNFYNLYQQAPCGPCLWVLDGARHLSDEMIEQLYILSKKCPETLYILATAQAPNMLRHALDIHIEPLSMVESRRLMEMFFAQLPPIEDPIFQAFLSGCEGNPAVLLQWQSDQQVNLRGDTEKTSRLSWHIVLLAVTLAILMVAFIYQKELIALLPSEEQDAQVDTVLPTAQVLSTEQATETLKSGPAVSTSTPSSTINDTQIQSPEGNELPIEKQNHRSQQHDIAAIVSALAKNSIPAETNQPEESQNTASSVSEKVIEQSTQEVQQNVELVVPDTAQEAQSDKDTDEGNGLSPSRTDPVMNDGAWLMTRDDSEWALQLLAVKDKAVAKEFIDQHRLRNVKIYEANRSDHAWWIVILGPFATLELAQEAKLALPEQILNAQPFFKKVDKIKQEISPPTR